MPLMQQKLPWTPGRIISAVVFWLSVGVTTLGLLIVFGSLTFGSSAPSGVAEDQPGGLDGLLALIGIVYGGLMIIVGGVATAVTGTVYYLVDRHLKQTTAFNFANKQPSLQPVVISSNLDEIPKS